MTTGASGLSVEQMLDLNRRFTQAGQQFATSRTTVNFSVMETWWAGPDAMRFRALWDGTLSPRLIRITEELFELANKITQEIQQQQQASAANGEGPNAPTASPLSPALATIKAFLDSLDNVDRFKDLLGVLSKRVAEAAGYVRTNGTEVAAYFRWAPNFGNLARFVSAATVAKVAAMFRWVPELAAPLVVLRSSLDAITQWDRDEAKELSTRVARAAAVGVGSLIKNTAGALVEYSMMMAGGALGSWVSPGVGTAIGAASGLAVGMQITEKFGEAFGPAWDAGFAQFGDDLLNNPPAALKTIGTLVETGRSKVVALLDDGANLVSKSLTSLFD